MLRDLTDILIVLSMALLIGCSGTGWQTVGEAEGDWLVAVDEAGNEWRRTVIRYPNGTAREKLEMKPAGAK